MKYKIIYSDAAIDDLKSLSDIIIDKYFAPATAEKYLRELLNTITDLSCFPERNAVREQASLKKYGIKTRRVNYKRMAIIYTVHEKEQTGKIVYIHRIVAASLISGL
jgi:plasmid stabilization system protein ParE